MQICVNKRNCLHKSRAQLSQDLFITQTSVAAVSLFCDTNMATVKSCWCPKPIPCELNLFAVQNLSSVPINLP